MLNGKIFTFLLVVFLISGCARIESSLYLYETASNGWTLEKGDDGSLKYINHCGEVVTSLSGFPETIRFDGSVYTIFFVIPVHSNIDIHKSHQKLHLIRTQAPAFKSCRNEDVRLIIKGEEAVADQSRFEGKYSFQSACHYYWNTPIVNSGNIIVKINNQSCSIPPLKVRYRSKIRYDYDAMAG